MHGLLAPASPELQASSFRLIMEIEKYIIRYKIGNDIPINPDWIRSKLQAAVKELQAEIDKKPLNGQHVLTLE